MKRFTVLYAAAVFALVVPVFAARSITLQDAEQSSAKTKKKTTQTPKKGAPAKTVSKTKPAAKTPEKTQTTSKNSQTTPAANKGTAKPGATANARNRPKTQPKPKPETPAATDADELSKLIALTDLNAKIDGLKKFVASRPDSPDKTRALEVLVSTRAQLGDEKLRFSDNEAGIQLFREAVADAPTPVSEKLFVEVMLQFPTNLFYRGQQAAAFEIAKLVGDKVSDNPKQILGVATFYLGTEKPDEAKKLAERAIGINNSMAANPQENISAYQTLGLAYRLDFQLEDAAKAYTEALKLNPDSVVSKRSLAEMERALGHSDVAATLYGELAEKDPTDMSSQNGLILSLFDAGRQTEAETALGKSLEANPTNLFLSVGVAYWYAGHKNGDKAIEFAQKAIAAEPRYTWAYIALARGYLLKKQPLDAEKALLVARQYGSFPTLDYELATARTEAGFFEEVANALKKSFVVKEDVITTNLAGRAPKDAKDFVELLDLERRASIFEPASADTPENAERLKTLLNFAQGAESADIDVTSLNKAVDEFVKGTDNMRIHRQLYAADQLLKARKDYPKILELAQNAVKGVDTSLQVASPVAAILADQLVESRTLAITKGEVIVVPQVPDQMLLNIVRGNIEGAAGWALFQEDKKADAIVRLKRAVSIFPEKSAWWRTNMWRLAVAQESNGNTRDALDNYVKCYTNSLPDAIKWTTVETAYRKVNGNTDGLEKLIGPKPFVQETVAQIGPKPGPEPTPEATPTVVPAETPSANGSTDTATPTPTPVSTTEARVETTPSPEPKPETTPTPGPKTEPTPAPDLKKDSSKTAADKTDVPDDSQTAKKTTEPVKSSTPKPLFEPVIITVPKSEIVKAPVNDSLTNSTKKVDDKSSDATAKKAGDPADGKTAGDKPAGQDADSKNSPADEKAGKPADASAGDTGKSDKPSDKTVADISRPRLVKDPLAPAEDLPSCLVASQDNLSILNGGGNLGILVGYVADGDTANIKVKINNPDDIGVTREPDIGKQSSRAFFVIKSLSENKGLFTVTFTSPCGKKDVIVKVR